MACETNPIEPHPAYPTPEHEAAARIIADHFSRRPATEAVLLVGSCARGRAVPGSCVDVAVLVRPEVTAEERAAVQEGWEGVYAAEPAFAALRRHGPFAHVDLDVVDGQFRPGYHGWTSGPDAFELEIGNTLAYSAPLWRRGGYYDALRAQWLPYYAEDLRRERLAAVTLFCRNNLEHIPIYVQRRLYFQAFDRLYKAFGEFLQALFIARRTYPIAYDKWIHEQIVEILGLPDLYPQLPALFEIRHFESGEIAEKGRALEGLLARYVEQG
ncbi:MAG: nucleotidyltransferase domain-containing protein [Chloroflexi bacterium]|nr:nucleotidyltransferase domain-containing protein [Chloroflexota bacterium]